MLSKRLFALVPSQWLFDIGFWAGQYELLLFACALPQVCKILRRHCLHSLSILPGLRT